MLKIKFLVIALAISFAGMFTSCYTDYGIDPTNSDVTVTVYNTEYNFQGVQKFYLKPQVLQIGSGTNNTTYDTQILNELQTQLVGLGWQQITDTTQLTTPGVVTVAAGVTTSTIIVNSGYYWGDYYGYGWYYPPYYDYSYSYTTGTLIMLITDYSQASSSNAPVEWSGICNAAINQGTSTTTLITQGINQAFAQSAYLKKNN